VLPFNSLSQCAAPERSVAQAGQLAVRMRAIFGYGHALPCRWAWSAVVWEPTLPAPRILCASVGRDAAEPDPSVAGGNP